MKQHDINAFTKGWFIGPFQPTLLHTESFECAVKHYKAGDKELSHVHRIATEYTVIASGTVKMGGQIYHADTIIEVNAGEVTDFEALTDAVTFVVKVPGVQGDKYIVGDK